MVVIQGEREKFVKRIRDDEFEDDDDDDDDEDLDKLAQKSGESSISFLKVQWYINC